MHQDVMKLKKGKQLTAIICILGISATAYGMAAKKDLFFIIGLVLIISGYLFIRKKLKDKTPPPPSSMNIFINIRCL